MSFSRLNVPAVPPLSYRSDIDVAFVLVIVVAIRAVFEIEVGLQARPQGFEGEDADNEVEGLRWPLNSFLYHIDPD